jgi:hypothetical protein
MIKIFLALILILGLYVRAIFISYLKTTAASSISYLFAIQRTDFSIAKAIFLLKFLITNL